MSLLHVCFEFVDVEGMKAGPFWSFRNNGVVYINICPTALTVEAMSICSFQVSGGGQIVVQHVIVMSSLLAH